MKKKNSTKECIKCGAEIKYSALKCPECKEKQPVKAGRVILGISLMFLFLVIVVIGFSGDSGQSSVPSTPTESQTYIISQSFVEDYLTAPSTADFPLGVYTYKALDNDRAIVISYVDSQNGFGAMVRSDYVATVKYLGGDWNQRGNWELERLVINGQEMYP